MIFFIVFSDTLGMHNYIMHVWHLIQCVIYCIVMVVFANGVIQYLGFIFFVLCDMLLLDNVRMFLSFLIVIGPIKTHG